jgi:hypothetical protein
VFLDATSNELGYACKFVLENQVQIYPLGRSKIEVVRDGGRGRKVVREEKVKVKEEALTGRQRGRAMCHRSCPN